MALRFPDFSDPYLEQLEACGLIQPADAAGIEWGDDLCKRARYDSANGPAFILLIVNWAGTGGDQSEQRPLHVHLEVAKESFFEGDLPNTDATVEEIQAAIGTFQDKPIRLILDSRFVVPLEKLPKSSIVRPLMEIETESRGMRVRMTGGQFAISPSPPRYLKWSVNEDESGSSLVVDLLGGTVAAVTEDYLDHSLAVLTPALDTVIFAGIRPEHDRPSERARSNG